VGARFNTVPPYSGSMLKVSFQKLNQQQQALVLGLLTVLCWSTMATVFKLSLQHLTPIQLIVVACCVSFIFLMAVLLWQGRFRQLFLLDQSEYLWSILFASMNPALYYWLLFSAYDILPAQEAQAINFSWAIVLTLLAVPLLGQRLLWSDIVAALVCYLGVLVIATQGNLLTLKFENSYGAFLAILSTLVWSLYWIFNRRDTREPILGLTLNFAFAIPIVTVFAWHSGDLSVLFEAPSYAWLGAIYVGVFEMGLAFILWLSAMKRATNTSQLANLIFIAPFLSLIFIAFFLSEEIRLSTLAGLILIIAGLLVQQRFKQEPVPNK